MSGDAQAGAGDRFAVLVVQVRGYGLDGFAVESGAGEIGQADFVAAYFQIVGGALSQCLADLDQIVGEWLDVRTCVPDGMSISVNRQRVYSQSNQR